MIQQLIKGEYISQGQTVHVPVKSVRIDIGIATSSKELLIECGLVGKALVVSDVNTHAVLGAKIEKTLDISASMQGMGASLIFENGVKADIVNVEKIKSAASSCDYIVAVGSGTINDLCKYASFLLNKPYVVFGTAPSMNGYGSANASISISGHKKTLKAHLPQGIFLDLDILAKAPVRLIRSGLGDSVCRATAQADWLLSHLLLGTEYNELPFVLLRECEAELFTNSSGLISGNIEIMELLAYTLILSGFGMYIAGGSYPASQGEHMIAHTMEMAYGDSLPHSYHGEQIGITTLTMARLQESIVQGAMVMVQNRFFPETLNLAPETLKECQSEYSAKQFSKEKLDEINHNIKSNWNYVRQRISPVMLPYNTIYTTLANAGCQLKSQDIGWQDGQYKNALSFAKFTRDRFTFLDL